TVGDRSVLAGQVGVPDNVKIGSDVILMAQAGVTKDIPEPGAYFGTPARPRAEIAREIAAVRRLARKGAKDRRS
ncbi:MAG: UDP-3-O-(3-hydroxymyristoyl)glucosamine N-acyltransferase, partial [Planctomycetota bacterium]